MPAPQQRERISAAVAYVLLSMSKVDLLSHCIGSEAS